MDNNTYHKLFKRYGKLYKSLVGSGMDENDFKVIEKHNQNVYFDQGKNNIWMEELIPNKKINNIDIENVTTDEFEQYLSDIMHDRYYIRDSNLDKLMHYIKLQYGNIIDIDFLEDFYINMFKGTSFKKYFDPRTEINDDLRKRFNIFYEFDESDPSKVPVKRYYTFVDRPNPCHLIKIMKDEFDRGDPNIDALPINYAFTNVKELGRGKAGTASLFSYYSSKNNNLKLAVKLMGSNQFTLTNNGKYLPLRITYFDKLTNSASVPKSDRNYRFIYPEKFISEILKSYPSYEKYNIFNTTHNRYNNIMLSAASDNFSNQTIIHIILEHILEKFSITNYVKQYDAMLCLNTTDTFTSEYGNSLWEMLKSGTTSVLDYLGKSLKFVDATIDGLNFMEIADAGDLYTHLFNIQKQYFSRVRIMDDLTKYDSSKFRSDFSFNNDVYEDGTMYSTVKIFLDDMITQILRPMSILQHSKYAFIHGDMKTKNIFVKTNDINTDNKKSYIYKIADYDKSSINYNGIRFYNEGNMAVKLLLAFYGPGEYTSNRENIVDESGWYQMKSKLFKSDNKRIMEYDFGNPEHIELILNQSDIDMNSIFYDISLNYFINDTDQTRKTFRSNVDLLYKKGFDMNEFVKFIENRVKYLDPTTKIKLSNNYMNDILALYTILNDMKKRGIEIDVFYDLNGLIAKLSSFVTSLQSIEFEQFWVRYLPVPFYHTIDLYTLFLSLLQSPLVFTYLKYCHNLVLSGKVCDSVFWNSFRQLWISDDDIYTIFGYYEYLYKNPSLDDMASIGFILDPIKKNPISLIKRIKDNYWSTIWGNDVWDSKIKPILDRNDFEKPLLKLSSGSYLTYPQVCLTTDCGDFEMKVHRDGKVFYINKDLVVYNTISIGEQLKILKGDRKDIENSARMKFENTIKQGIIDYIDANLYDDKIDGLRKLFNITDISLDGLKKENQDAIDKETDIMITNRIDEYLKNNICFTRDRLGKICLQQIDYTKLNNILKNSDLDNRIRQIALDITPIELNRLNADIELKANEMRQIEDAFKFDRKIGDLQIQQLTEYFKTAIYWKSLFKYIYLPDIPRNVIETVYNSKYFDELSAETKDIMNKNKELILNISNPNLSVSNNWGENDIKIIIDSIKLITLSSMPKEDSQKIKSLKDKLNNDLQEVAETIGYAKSVDGSFVPIKNISKNVINKALENLKISQLYIDIIKSNSIEIYEPNENEIIQINQSIIDADKNIKLIVNQLESERDKRKQDIQNKKTSTTELLKNKFDRIKNYINTLNANDITKISPYKTSDLINISKTNSYKDAFGNYTNWDFCPITDDKIIAIIKELINNKLIIPNKI